MSRLSERLSWNPYQWFEPHIPPTQVPQEPPPLVPLGTEDVRFTIHPTSRQSLPRTYARPMRKPGHGSRYTPSHLSGSVVPVLAREQQHGFLVALLVGGEE